ncbi:hypothetical protein M7I_2568 [Glarea lozoyensis 74030]|uniref:Uncharacterized protein n=1 Tax=Glarea lozoyensis (strain ATCC 74030 / MF5533) TaxID=1104152 RepID=H0EJ44_GLAL7|nr:hypothetical protein M7I_2568 [Glarea lozoyensis 74030]
MEDIFATAIFHGNGASDAVSNYDLKSPLLVTFVLFLIVTICYANINPSMNHAQIGFNIIAGIGQTGPLMVLPALIQFTSPHAFLSTATGLAFSARALGGAFGSAILNTIINSELSRSYARKVSAAALNAGLPTTSIPELLEAFASGKGFESIPGINAGILREATITSREVYARAYRLAWSTSVTGIEPYNRLPLYIQWA